MSDYIKRKKKNKKKWETDADSGLRNVDGQTVEEYRKMKAQGKTAEDWRREKDKTMSAESDAGLWNLYDQTPEEYRKMKTTGGQLDDLDKWKGESEKILREYAHYSYSEDYQSKESHDNYANQIEKQLKKTISLRKKYAGRSDEIDDVVEKLSNAAIDNDEGREYYSKWDNDETYQQFRRYEEENERRQKEFADFSALSSKEMAQEIQEQKKETGLYARLTDKEYKEQKRQYEEALKKKQLEEASMLPQRADFDEKSVYIPVGKNYLGKEAFRDEDYEYINDSESGFRKSRGLDENDLSSRWAQRGLGYVSDQERKTYNYLYATEGKEKAGEYIKNLEPILAERMTNAAKENARNYAKEHPILSSAESVVSNVVHSGEGFTDSLGRWIRGEGVDVNSHGNLAQNMNNEIRNAITEEIDSNAGKLAYQIGMSMADSAAAAGAAGMIGTPAAKPETASFLGGIIEKVIANPEAAASLIMAGNAASQGVIEAKERGTLDGKAILTGTIQGATEYLLEKIPLDQLKMFAQTPPESVKGILKNIAKGAATEGIEEGATSVINMVADKFVNKDFSEFNQTMQQYMEYGLSEEEAKRKTIGDMAYSVAMDAFAGAVSGGIMSGGVSSLGYALNKSQTETQVPEERIPSEETQVVEQQNDPEEIPFEEAEMYSGENPEVAPAQQVSEKLKPEETKIQAAKDVVDTVLEYGSVPDDMAAEIAENNNMRAALEEKTGVKLSGNKEQQKNAVKEIVRVFGERKETMLPNDTQTPPTVQNAVVRGKSVEITGIDIKDDLKPKFKAVDGRAYEAKDVNFTKDSERKLYSDAARFAVVAGKEAANEYVRLYDPKMSLPAYAKSFDFFYKMGKNGVPLSTALKSADVFVSMTSKESMSKAWSMGMDYRKEENARVAVKKVQQKRKGTGTYKDETRLKNPTREIAMLLANKTGIDIIRKAELQNDANAAFIPSMMTMLVSERAENEYTALIHELGEFGLAYDREGMKEVQETLVKWWAEKEGIRGMEELDDILDNYQRVYKKAEGSKTREQAMDEIVNDAIGGLLSTETGAEEFVDWLKTDSGYSTGEQKTIVQRIMDILDKVIQYLKDLIGKSDLSTAAKKTAQMEEQQAKKVRQKLFEAFDRAIEKANTSGVYENETPLNGNRLSLKVDIDGEIGYFEIENKLNDYIAVQKAVTEKIGESLYGDYENKETGMIISIGKKGIKETLSSGKRFQSLPKYIKKLKVATIQRLPEIIEKSSLLNDDVENIHGKSSRFAYFKAKMDINDEPCEIRIAVKKTSAKNHFWMHYIDIEKKDSILLTSAKEEEVQETKNPFESIISDDSQNTREKQKFSLKDPVEETKNLVAVHNLKETNMLKTLELGGFPMPSIAVTKAELGHDEFGEISVVFRKETIDPKNKKNKVYGADAWTPTFPRVEYEANKEQVWQIRERAKKHEVPGMYANDARGLLNALEYNLNEYGGEEGVIERAKTNMGMKQLYLAEKGKAVEDVVTKKEIAMSETDIEISKEIIKNLGDEISEISGKSGREIYSNHGDLLRKCIKEALMKEGIKEYEAEDRASHYSKFEIVGKLRKARDFQENGPIKIVEGADDSATRDKINRRIDEKEYEKWLKDFFRGIEQKSGLQNGKDVFTSSGNRRSFDETHMPFNVENVVKAMLQQSEDVRNVDGFYGVKSVRAVATEDFRSIDQIKEASGKLQDIDSVEYERMNQKIEERLYRVIADIVDDSVGRSSGNRMMDMEYAGYGIIEACKKPTAENIKKVLTESHWNCTKQQAGEIADIIREVQNMPVNMFEAKPQRVVGFHEVAAVMVPDTMTEETKSRISAAGMNLVEYKAGDKQSRLDLLNELEDIKFSLPTDQEENSVDNVIRSSEEYQSVRDQIAEQLRKQDVAVEITDTSVKAVAARMAKKYKSFEDVTTLESDIGALFKNMASGGTENTGNHIYTAESIVRPMLEQSEKNLTINDYSKEILKDIKGKRIKLDKIQSEEVAYHYGTYNDFRKKLFGRAYLSKEGTPLDILWKEWASAYPEWFQEDLSPADQPVRLAEIIDSLKEDYVNEYGFTLDETVTYAAAELMQEYFNLPEVKAQFSGKVEFKDNLEGYMENLKQEYHQKYVEYTKYFSERYKQIPKEYRQRMARQQARQQAKFDKRTSEERAKRLERQNKKKYRDRIVKNTKDVLKILEDNTDKRHVPEVLKKLTINFLESMDFVSEDGWKNQTTVQLQNRLNLIFRKFSDDAGHNEGSEFMGDMDPDFLPKLSEMIEKLEESTEVKKIGEMDSDQLKDVDYLVYTLKRAISTANKLIANEQYEKISQIGDASMRHMSELKAKRRRNKIAMMDKMLNIHMLAPNTFFKHMGEGAMSIYHELREGLNKRTWMLKNAQTYMEDALKDIKVKDWTGKKAKKHFFEYNGKKFELTEGQLMNLYILSKRPQALGHLTAKAGSEGSGFVIDTKSIVRKQEIPERTIKVSEAQLNEMFQKLTPEQKRVADRMQRFLAKDCADWGNEVSMILYGYKKFGEKTYWPIKTSDNFNGTNDKNADNAGETANASLYGIRNLGMTKNLVKKANNPIVVGDIFDVFSEHVANMANYNAFVVPLTDAMKWFNYKSRTEEGAVTGSLKEEMERAFGTGAKGYFIELIKNINGETGKGVATEISSTFSGRYKAAAVGANIRTVIQQPTAFFRVSSVMNPKYMMKAAGKRPAVKEMMENSAIAMWKSWGYFETGIGQSMKQVITGESTAAERLVELSMEGAGKADDITWGIIWNAVKEEIRDKNKDLDLDSEEYKKLVRERFDEVIDETQVVDTVLHRSQIMRSNNGFAKFATAFMAEPTKSYNLLYDAWWNWKQNYTAESGIKVLRAATVYALTGIATAAAASMVDVFRDDDEEKEWSEKYMENFKENMADNLNPLNMIPYLKEIPSFVKGFDATRMDVEGIGNLVNSVMQIGKYFEGTSKKTPYGLTKNIIRSLSQVTGIPAYNLLRDTEAFIEQFTFAPFDEEQMTGKTVRIRLLKAVNEGNDEQLKKYLAWYEEQYQKKIEDGKTPDEARAALKSSITRQYKEIYQKASPEEKVKIKSLLYKISAGNKQLYKDYDWSDWDQK